MNLSYLNWSRDYFLQSEKEKNGGSVEVCGVFMLSVSTSVSCAIKTMHSEIPSWVMASLNNLRETFWINGDLQLVLEHQTKWLCAEWSWQMLTCKFDTWKFQSPARSSWINLNANNYAKVITIEKEEICDDNEHGHLSSS